MHGHGLPIVYTPGGDFADTGGNGRPTPLRKPKASEVVAARIVQDIVDARLSPGDRLRPEAEMLEHYGVSRESLREALRILEVQGLITLKRGPNGGPIVSVINASYLARTATLYFNLSSATYADVFEVWADLEPALAGKVARIRDRDLKRAALGRFLDDVAPELEDDDALTFSRNNSFHAVLADLAGNPVLTLLTQAVSHIVVDHVVENVDPVHDLDNLESAHDVIAQAIIDGRASKATRLMREHIEGITQQFRDRWPDRLAEPIHWR